MSDGVLLIDKPAGKTSHDIVAAVRRESRAHPPHPPDPPRRVGHAGTLDPFATGLLLVLVGRATRIQRYLMALPKRYETVARLGWVSTTGDIDGEITRTGRVPPDPPPLPTGELLQRPHAYSAVKVGGRRAYELARAGQEVQLDARPITVYRFEQLWREEERAAFAIECSAGTYVRSLVAELDDAYCEQLRRTAIGPFEVADADPSRLVPLADALARILPTVRLDADEARRAGHGSLVAAQGPEGAADVLLLDDEGPIAIAQPQNGGLKPVVGFRA